MTCDLKISIDERMNRLITQYRESPKLIGLIRLILKQVDSVHDHLCSIPDFFDIDTANGDQLTILGKVLGWPRTHCNGKRLPVFGFDCSQSCRTRKYIIGGFCSDATWSCDEQPAYTDYTFINDNLYRKFLKSMIIKLDRDYSHSGIREATQLLFGENANIYIEGNGGVSIYAGRFLDDEEIEIAHLYQHVMPVPDGIELNIYENGATPFGFGTGWGEFCTGEFPTLII